MACNTCNKVRRTINKAISVAGVKYQLPMIEDKPKVQQVVNPAWPQRKGVNDV
jgi:hypothetical protein